MSRLRLTACLGVLALVLGSCVSKVLEVWLPPGEWSVITIQGERVVSDSLAKISFDAASTVQGNDSVNAAMRGSESVVLSDVEQRFLAAFDQAVESELEATGQVAFRDRSGAEVLRLRDAAFREARLSGTVTLRERVALGPDHLLVVLLERVNDTGICPAIGDDIRVVQGQVPLSFEVIYDERSVDPHERYALRAELYHRTVLQWATTKAYPVTLGDGPTKTYELLLERAAP